MEGDHTSLMIKDLTVYRKFRGRMIQEGTDVSTHLNKYMKKYVETQMTTLNDFSDDVKLPGLYDEMDVWKKYKSHLNPKDWKKFDDRLSILINLSNKRREELQRVGLIW